MSDADATADDVVAGTPSRYATCTFATPAVGVPVANCGTMRYFAPPLSVTSLPLLPHASVVA